jgi:hypothetical protein
MRFNCVLIEIGWRFLEGFEVRLCFDIWSQPTPPNFRLQSLPMTNLPWHSLAISPLTLAALLHFPLISILNLPNRYFERHSPDTNRSPSYFEILTKLWPTFARKADSKVDSKPSIFRKTHNTGHNSVCCAVPTTRVEPFEPAAHQKPTNHRFFVRRKARKKCENLFNNSQVGVVTINFHLRCEHYEELCLLLFRDAAPTPSRWLSAKAVNLFTCFTASVTLVRFSQFAFFLLRRLNQAPKSTKCH